MLTVYNKHQHVIIPRTILNARRESHDGKNQPTTVPFGARSGGEANGRRVWHDSQWLDGDEIFSPPLLLSLLTLVSMLKLKRFSCILCFLIF
jgi:hypothetical protein